MKRDECDGALHEIPMREAPQRSKCYILISTVTLCYSLHSPEGRAAESFEHAAQCRNTDSRGAGMWARAGDGTHAGSVPPQWAGRRGRRREGKICCHTSSQCVGGVLAVSPECRHAVRRFGHSGGQKKCVHDSDSFVARRMSERVSRDTRVHQRNQLGVLQPEERGNVKPRPCLSVIIDWYRAGGCGSGVLLSGRLLV